MIGLLLANWRIVVMALLVAAVGFYKWRFERERTEFQNYRTETRAAGLAAEMRAKEIALRDLKRKEHADAENATTVANLATTAHRLRLARADRSYLPPAATNSPSPATACVNRADADGAIRGFIEETSRLIEEGDRAIADLNTAKVWSQAPQR